VKTREKIQTGRINGGVITHQERRSVSLRETTKNKWGGMQEQGLNRRTIK